MGMISTSAPLSRRTALDKRNQQRALAYLRQAAKDVHARRVREWAQTDSGSFPSWWDSRQIAAEEVGLLVRALGGLNALTPEQYDLARYCLHRR